MSYGRTAVQINIKSALSSSVTHKISLSNPPTELGYRIHIFVGDYCFSLQNIHYVMHVSNVSRLQIRFPSRGRHQFHWNYITSNWAFIVNQSNTIENIKITISTPPLN